jgi:hypothetical protein
MSAAPTKEEAPDFLGMSDEELINFNPSKLDATEAPAEAEVPETVAVEEDAPATEEVADEVAETDAEEGAAEDLDESKPEGTDGEAPVKAKPVVEKETPKETPAPEKAAVDYQAEYNKMFAPFKANGKEMKVENAEDAITLMKMGANYNLKMAALKPNLKLMKMLENNNLLSEERLSYLIDLDKKDPAAISKLVKDSGLDPLDLGAEQAGKYKANTYTVDDRQMELDTVLDALESTPTYTRILDIVSNKWDAQSKQHVSANPQLLTLINDHMQSGIYDTIATEVERERTLGRLTNLSDLEAYKQVGDAINARGGFAPQQTPAKTVAVPAKPKVDEAALRDKRRAASSTKSAGPAAAAKDFNPLSMSDAEFSKQANSRYL